MAAADSLQLLLLVTLAKLGTRVKFCSCREVLEGFRDGRTRGGEVGRIGKGGCRRRGAARGWQRGGRGGYGEGRANEHVRH